MKSGNVWMWAAAALLCTTIVSSYMAVSLQSQVKELQTGYDALLEDIESLQGSLDDLTIQISMKIDYGNGTVVWHNETRVPLNANLLTATKIISEIEYSMGEFGAFIEEIDGVGGDPGTYWLWNYYDRDSGKWEFGLVASDAWVLHNEDVVSWVYSRL